MSKTEIHAQCLFDIKKALTKGAFEDIKYLCKAYLEPAELEQVTNFWDLVNRLETKGYEVSWQCGGYRLLVYLLDTANLPLIVNIVKTFEGKVNVQAESTGKDLHKGSSRSKMAIHLRLLLKIKNKLTPTIITDLKNFCKEDLQATELEQLTDFREIVNKLESRGCEVSFLCGGYSKLVAMFKYVDEPHIESLIKECENEVNAQTDELFEANDHCAKPDTSSFQTPKKRKKEEHGVNEISCKRAKEAQSIGQVSSGASAWSEMSGLFTPSEYSNRYYMVEVQRTIRNCELNKIPRGAIRVAVFDSGIKLSHLAFQSFYEMIVTKDLINDVTDPIDKDLTGHGTACAAIIAADEYDKEANRKYTGAAPFADLVVCKVAKKMGNVNKVPARAVIKALNFLNTEHDNVDIINMSFGVTFDEKADRDELQRDIMIACQKRVVVCAASNEGMRDAETIAYPAKYGTSICVGSCDEHNNRSLSSGVGKELDFLAQGEDLWCPTSSSVGHEFSGTSAAAPLVASIAAQVLVLAEKWGNEIESGLGTSLKERFTNTHRMKEVLKKMATHTTHNSKNGYGALKPQKLFKSKAYFIETLKNIGEGC